MDNDDLPVGKILTRRDLLGMGAAGAMILAGLRTQRNGMAFAQGQGGIVASPALTEGPYFVDERLNRSDIRENRRGLPMYLTVTLSQLNSGVLSPLPNAAFDIWHCDAMGKYSDISSEGTLGQKWLRGYQMSDANGKTRFTTIFPGWYSGRTVHIHAKVRQFNSANNVTYELSSQFFVNDRITDEIYAGNAPYNTRAARNTRNTNDGIYMGGSNNNVTTSQSGARLLLRLAPDRSYAVATFNIILDLAAGSFPGRGGGPPR